jgi:RimJ/RimL family protein N-acetyltransferase
MAYKAMRLEALQNEAGMFGSSYAREAAFTDAQWMERIVNPNSACLGLYYKNELAGITGIITDNEHTGLGHMVQSYIRKPHRGKGLSNILYQARLKWAREHNLNRIQVGHKASNIASKAASLRFGFKYTHSEPRTWPDSSVEDVLYYELKL